MRPLVLLLLSAAAWSLAPEPDAVDRAVQGFCAQRPHLHYRVAGTSPGGRTIPLVVATADPAHLERQLRVLVITRQHGDEPAPAQAALLWLRAEADTAAAFRHVAVLLLPTLNPDGAAAGTRANGAGVDLNRDWQRRSQPETRLVVTLFDRWQPHVVVDLHEFTGVVKGRRVHPDWVEMLATGRPPERLLDDVAGAAMRHLVFQQRAVGEPVTTIISHPGDSSPTLCHRYFAGQRRAVSFLVEVGDGRADPAARLLGLLVDWLSDRAGRLKPGLDRLRGLESWQAPRDLAPVPAPAPTAPLPVPAPATPPPLWMGLAVYGLVMLAGAKNRGEPADR